ACATEVVRKPYEPIEQQPNGPANFYRRLNLVVRATAEPSSLVPAIRAAIQRLDPELPLSEAMPAADVVSESVKPQRFAMAVVGLFALVALGPAAIGAYGGVANTGLQQTHA